LILVVDDLKEQRQITSMMLEFLGYSVECFSSGEEAVDFIRRNPADLIILDMVMDPGMDGLDTYKEIIKIRPGQKAILATGYPGHERVKELKNIGVNKCLIKPFSLDTLKKTVLEELEERRPHA
jgi:DNA-binding NtrC family response regulator